MWISKKELLALSQGIRGSLDGQPFDPRDNKEGAFSILKNDLYSLAHSRQEQRNVLEEDKERMAKYLSDISHQLKTPLAALNLYQELLQNEAEDPDAVRAFAAKIAAALARMEQLIQSMLKLTRLFLAEMARRLDEEG